MATEHKEEELIQRYLNKIPLELIILIAALGHAFLIYDKVVLLVGIYVPKPILLISCIAAEFLVARAGTWGLPGVIMSTLMVGVSIFGILFVHELLHVYFGILILTGVIGQFVRSEIARKKEEQVLESLKVKLVGTQVPGTALTAVPQVKTDGTLNSQELLKLGVAELGRKLGIAQYHRAQKVRQRLLAGEILTVDEIAKLRT